MEAKLEVISGSRNRAKAANDVHAVYSTLCDDAMAACESMAGCCIVVWDDEGNMTVHTHRGPNCPLPGVMVPSLVKDVLTVHMVRDQ